MLGKNDGAPLVVRQRAPALRWTLLGAAVLVGLFAFYVVYELGRYDAGYDRQAVAQQRTELEVQIEHLENTNREMRTKLAELDTIRVGRAHEQAEVARAMGDLQAQVARQSQELAFYRGVVAQGAAPLGVKIEQLRVTAGTPRHLHRAPVAGALRARRELGRGHRAAQSRWHRRRRRQVARSRRPHRRQGARAALQLPLLPDPRPGDQVPLAFKPEQLSVEVQASRQDIAPLSQTFLWNVESAP